MKKTAVEYIVRNKDTGSIDFDASTEAFRGDLVELSTTEGSSDEDLLSTISTLRDEFPSMEGKWNKETLSSQMVNKLAVNAETGEPDPSLHTAYTKKVSDFFARHKEYKFPRGRGQSFVFPGETAQAAE